MRTSGLIRRLAAADRAWRRNGAFEWFLRSIKLICAVVALLVAIDLIGQLASLPRLIAATAAGMAFLAYLGFLCRKAFRRSRSLLPVARHLEDRDDSLGSKLVNAIQLQEQAGDESMPPLTRQLAALAVDEAAGGVAGRNFIPLTKSPTMARSFRRALLPLALLILPAIVFAPVAWREALRFVDPFGDHPPFSFTHLKIVNPEGNETRIVYHRPVTIEAAYSGHRPRELFLEIENAASPGEATSIPMFPQADNRFVQQIDQVDTDLVVRARTQSGRSISEARLIGVILTPQLEKASIAVRPPPYTKLSRRESNLALERSTAPTLSVLAGSEVDFLLTSNRPLSEGSIGLQSANPASAEFPLRAGDAENPHTARARMTAAESGRLRFDLRDINGLPADRELAANLIVTHDLPPEVAIVEPAADGFIVDTFAAKVAVRSSDDYGLRTVRIHTGINDVFGKPKSIEAQADPPQRDSLETLEIAPSEMGASPGDVISLFAETTDIRPEPQMARSRTLKLQVISEEDYNDHLRLQTEIRDLEQKYAALHDELRDLARQQRDLAARAEAAKEAADQEKRDRLAAEQHELNARLMKLAERMESTTRDQPLYDLEKDLQKVLDTEARKIRDSVAMNQKSVASFAGKTPSGPAMQEFGEEGEAQADRLDPAREEAEKRIAEALEDADLIQQLLKALAAYEELYRYQEDLASQTAAYKSGPEMSHDDRLALQQMAGTERLVGEGLEKIVESLRAAAARALDAYPEAAGDARDIAAAIEGANLSNLAGNAARTMLTGRGAASHDQAEHLREEMEKLMGACGQCQGGMGDEFTLRLKLMRQMLAGNTFSQMAQSRNFGLNPGQGMSMGGGGMGIAGFAGMGGPQMGPQTSLLGGESTLGRNAREESATPSKGKAAGTPSPEVAIADNPGDDSETGPSRNHQPARSATGEAMVDEYSDLVDAYFRKLTASKSEQP